MEHFIGRLCEEFHCLPSEAWREWQRLPAGFMETVIEYRAYAQAKALVDSADTAEARKRLPRTEMVNLVDVIEFELRQAEIARG